MQQIPKTIQRGFTLLEIMLVIVVMGMISVSVVMTLPDNYMGDRSPDWQAQRLSTLVQFVKDEALISGTEYGIVFTKENYQFAQYHYDQKKWFAVDNIDIEQTVTLPEDIFLDYALSGSVWDEIENEDEGAFIDEDYLVDIETSQDEVKSLEPQVYIMSSGEVTPFTAAFYTEESAKKVQLSVTMNGDVEISELEE